MFRSTLLTSFLVLALGQSACELADVCDDTTSLLSLRGDHQSGATVRDNDIHLDNTGSVDFELHGHSISSGQPWVGVSHNFDKLTVKAGRHGSSAPADFFLRDLGPANVVGNLVHSHRFPDDLNFAFNGDLIMNLDAISVRCQGIRFGQGHNGDNNNWWVGGPNCAGGNDPGDAITCACNDGVHVRFDHTNHPDHFSLSVENRCAQIRNREGYWVAVTAAHGTIGYSFQSSSTEYTETDFTASLSASFSPTLSFGELELSAEVSSRYVRQSTSSSSWSKTCSTTVAEGHRLWQWVYSVTTNCGANSISSCYFQSFPVDNSKPCCLAGFQSPDPHRCTEALKNMCTGE